MLKFALVVSRFNEEITQGLLKGALTFLNEKKIDTTESDIFYAPGSFEVPIIAQKLARSKKYAGVIGLGCIIKGETAHFEFISLGATMGIMQAMLTTEVPIAFGILTTYTDEQAEERSLATRHNKGWEAASACYETVQTLARIDLG